MKIVGLTVCVDYAPLLKRGIEKWIEGLDDLVVVTAPHDAATMALCKEYLVEYHVSELFYANGAKFNKGAVIAEAYERMCPSEWGGWRLFFDADIEPEKGWRNLIPRELSKTKLYGSARYQSDGRLITDSGLAGYFLLAHSSDPNMLVKPIVDTHWFHAGNYDSTFMDRWPEVDRIKFLIGLTHHGEPGDNWCGIGNKPLVDAIHAERKRRDGQWSHETIEEAHDGE